MNGWLNTYWIPWVVELCGRAQSQAIIGTQKSLLRLGWLSLGERQKTNARLIAAAPEMLEALETVVRAIESPEWQAWEGKAFLTEARRGYPAGSGYQGEQFMESVKSAIAKAKGEYDGMNRSRGGMGRSSTKRLNEKHMKLLPMACPLDCSGTKTTLESQLPHRTCWRLW